MTNIKVSIKKLSNLGDLPLPSYATLHSAGLDLLAAINDDIIIKPLCRELVPTGISIALPDGCEAQIRPRSGLAFKHGITVLNSPGTIDADYRGEIKILLINLGAEDFKIERGMRCAQLILAQYCSVNWSLVEDLSTSNRGEGGFGSTGT